MSDVDAPTATLSGVVVVLLVDFLRQHRAWGWLRMVQGPSALKSTPGLLFAKVMGSGHDGGFGLRPSASHQGWVCLFDTHSHARAHHHHAGFRHGRFQATGKRRGCHRRAPATRLASPARACAQTSTR